MMTAIRLFLGVPMVAAALLMLPDALDGRHPTKLRLTIGGAAVILVTLGVAIIGGGAP